MPVKTYYDRSPMGSTKKTPEGFLVFDAVATRSGIFIYYTPEGQARRAYRAPEEVFSRESMDSFALKPIINNHQKGVTPKMTCDNVKDYQIGQIGENIRRDKNYMRITGCISTKEGIAAVDAGRRGLSLAYDSVDIEEPGVSPSGEPYDYRQTQIRGNHLAIVDAGRAGPEACLHMDTADIFNEDGGAGSGNFGHEGRPGQQGGSGEGMNAGDLEKHIRGKAASGSKMHQRAVELIDKEGLTPHGAYHQAQEEYGHKQDSQDLLNLSQKERRMKYNLDGVEVEAPESIVNAVVKSRTDLATALAAVSAEKTASGLLKTNLDTMTAERDTAKAELVTLKAVDTNKLIMDGVAARIALVESASLVCDAEELKGKTDKEIRLAVIEKVFPKKDHPGMNMDGKSDDYIAAAFNSAVVAGDTAQRKDAVARQRKTAVSMDKDNHDNVDDAAKGASDALQQAYKQPCSLSAKK